MIDKILFHTRQEFRNWLKKNYTQEESIWLIFEKGKDSTTIKPQDALEEALCFGWIDGQFSRYDEKDDVKYLKKFSSRRKKSNWSERNKAIAKELIKSGLMTEAGLDKIEQAKKEGMWDISPKKDESKENIQELEIKLKNYPLAYNNFQNYPKSSKKLFAGFYADAKKEETKQKRLDKIIKLAEINKKQLM